MTDRREKGKRAEPPIERTYPRVTQWVKTQGWIEIGQDDYSRSFIRVLDEGGMVWEGGEMYASLDDALQAAEQGIEAWMREQFRA